MRADEHDGPEPKPPIAVVHHPLYVAPAPARSSYQWNKNGLVRDLLRDLGEALEWHEAEPMPRDWIEAVHDPEYVAQVVEARVPPENARRIGFPVTEAVAARAVVVPGGTYLAARLAMRLGFAANTAGGSHHALADTGAGYCVFNDLAIAAHRLAAEGERVLIVDCDVHQGDGTAALMAGRTWRPIRSMPRRTFRRERRDRRWTCRWPMARTTRRIWRR